MCDHSFPSKVTHQPLNTEGVAPEKEGTGEVQLSYSQGGGGGQSVCVQGPAQMFRIQIWVVRGKGFPGCGEFSPALGPQMLLFAKGILGPG